VLLADAHLRRSLSIFFCNFTIVKFTNNSFFIYFLTIKCVVSVRWCLFCRLLLSLRPMLLVYPQTLGWVRQRTNYPSQSLFGEIFSFRFIQSFFFTWQIWNSNWLNLTENMVTQLTLFCCVWTRLVLKRSTQSITRVWPSLTMSSSSYVINSISSVCWSNILKNFKVVKRLYCDILNTVVIIWMKPYYWLEPCRLYSKHLSNDSYFNVLLIILRYSHVRWRMVFFIRH